MKRGTLARPRKPQRPHLSTKRIKRPGITYLNAVFGAIIKARDSKTCRKCGRDPYHNPGLVLHCAHIYSVGAHPNMRWVLDNAVCLCHRCHIYWAHKSVVEFTEWAQKELGKKRWRSLSQFAGGPVSRVDTELTRIYLEAMAEHFGVTIPARRAMTACKGVDTRSPRRIIVGG